MKGLNIDSILDCRFFVEFLLEGDLEGGRKRISELNDAISLQNVNSSAHKSNLEGTRDMKNSYEYKYKIHIISIVILSIILIALLEKQ